MNEASLNTGNPSVQAPGAKGARLCGLFAILSACTCVLFPVALVLGIVALVLHSKAKQEAQRNPGIYAMPTNSAMVMGIVGLSLCVLAIPICLITAIAVPAVIAQRDNAMRRSVLMQVNTLKHELSNQAEMMRVEKGTFDVRQVASDVAMAHPYTNPYSKRLTNPEIAEHPSALGVISIWPGESPQTATSFTATVTFTIRASVKRAGTMEEVEEVVELYR